MDTHDNIAVWSSKFQKKTLEETKTTNYMNMTCAESFHFSQKNLKVRGGSKGGLGGAPAPLLLVHQWKYGEGEGEEEVEERRKK